MPPVVAGAAILAAGTFGAAALGATIAGALVNLGLGLIVSGIASELLQQKPKLAPQSRTVSVREPVSARPIIYGSVRCGGTIVFMHETGSKSQFLHLVIAIAGHEVEAINSVYFDGEEAIDAAGTPASRYSGLVFIEKRLGSPTQTALSQLQTDAPDKWTANHRLQGVAHVHLRLKFDVEAFPRGLPAISFDVDGKNDVFDPRTSTSGFTSNAALCVADYMSDPVFGLGLTIGAEDGLDSASVIAAANICDESVSLNGGGTESRYTVNGVLTTAVSPKQNLEGLLSAMAGRAIWPGGAWKIHAGAYRTPSVTLTDDDVAPEGLLVTSRISRNENFNGVRGQFISPTNDWQPDDFPAYQSATYVAEDQGEEIWNDIVLPFTTSAATAQRLAKIGLETQRRQLTVLFRGKLSAWRCAVGETVNLTYDRWGWSSKPFRVEKVSLTLRDGQLGCDLVLRETSSLIYSWLATEEEIYAAAPTTSLPSAFDIAVPGVPTLTESLYVTRDLIAKALIRADWAESNSAFAIEYQVQARRRLDADGVATGEAYRTLGRTDQTNWEIRDIAPGTWDVQVKAINALGVSSAYSTGTIVAAGLGAAPSALTGLRIQKAGGIAILKWDQSTDLDVVFGGRIVIRHSQSATPTWANSVSMDSVDGNTSNAAVPLRPGTYLIRAVDSTGVNGAVTSITTKGIQAVAFTNVQTFTADPTWSGTKTDTVVDGTALKLASGGGSFSFALTDSGEDTPGSQGNAAQVKTISGLSLGVAAADRVIYAAINAVSDTAISSVTIAGVTATIVGTQQTDESCVVAIYKASVPSGTTGDVVVTYATAVALDTGVMLYRATGVSTESVIASVSNESSQPAVIDLTGTVTAGATVLATAFGANTGAWTWSGLTERVDTDIRSTEHMTSAMDTSMAGGSTSISASAATGTQGGAGIAIEIIPQAGGPITEGMYEFQTAFDNTTVGAFRVRPDIDVSALNLTSTIDDRTDLIDTWPDFDDAEGAEIDVIVEMRHTDDDPSGSPTWSAWEQLDSTEEEFRGAEFRARLLTTSSDYNVLLAGLSIYIDEVV